MIVDEDCANRHRFKWGPLSPNENGRITGKNKEGKEPHPIDLLYCINGVVIAAQCTAILPTQLLLNLFTCVRIYEENHFRTYMSPNITLLGDRKKIFMPR